MYEVTIKVDVKTYGDYNQTRVLGFVNGDEVVSIYANGVQSSRSLPVNMEHAKAIVDAFQQALAVYQHIPKVNEFQ